MVAVDSLGLWLVTLLEAASLLSASPVRKSQAARPRVVSPAINGEIYPVVRTLINTAAPTFLTSNQVAAFRPYTKFARAVYCPVSETATWSCGTNCEGELPGFKVFGAGGDGDATQYWFVGYDPTFTKSIVIAHQGTNTTELIADLNDLVLAPTPLNPFIFPGVPPLALAHTGFQATQSRSWPGVLAAVKAGLASVQTSKVTVIGHSLGAAIATLDAIALPLHLPKNISYDLVTYGGPRVGDPIFAAWAGGIIKNLTRITNKLDPVPELPPSILDFIHLKNETHINGPQNASDSAPGVWAACPGTENYNALCINGAEPNLAVSNETNHDGPYDDIFLGQPGEVGCDLKQF